jgi:hypothetical protein
MSETILGAMVAALAVVFLLIHVLARRSVPAADAAVGPVSGRKENEPAGGSREHTPLLDSSVWHSAVVPDLTTAEELLDQAEQDGYRDRELIVLDHSTFLVRWRDRADGDES